MTKMHENEPLENRMTKMREDLKEKREKLGLKEVKQPHELNQSNQLDTPNDDWLEDASLHLEVSTENLSKTIVAVPTDAEKAQDHIDDEIIGATEPVIADIGPTIEIIKAEKPTSATLREAEDIILGARQAAYGPPENSFEAIAEVWKWYLEMKFDDGEIDLKPIDVSNMMVLMKISRGTSGCDKRDNYVDIAGYAGISGDLFIK